MGATNISEVMAKKLSSIGSGYQRLDISKYEEAAKSPLVKPANNMSWEELKVVLGEYVNLPGFLDSRIKKLYDAGYGAELVTAAEIAKAEANNKFKYFAAMTSQKSGNWESKTLEKVKEVWKHRKNALDIMTQLNLDPSSTKQILALCWRLKDKVQYFLSIVMKAQGIDSKKALFFWLTAKKQTSP